MKVKSFAGLLLAGGLLVPGSLFIEGCAKKVAAVKPPQTSPPVAIAASTSTPAKPEPARRPAPVAQVASVRTAKAPDQATKERIQTLLNRIQDAYFDYNTSNIRQDAQQALHADAQTLAEILRGYPDYKLTIEGYADERGSAEYNLGLGEARAKRALQFLVDSGIPSAQLMTTSFGKERQVCTEHDESCWQKNRRIHITQAQS